MALTNRQAAAVRRLATNGSRLIDALAELDAAFASCVHGPLIRERSNWLLVNLRLDLDTALEITDPAALRTRGAADPPRAGFWCHMRADEMLDIRALVSRERAAFMLDRLRAA